MKNTVERLFRHVSRRDDDGITAIEYGMMAAGIAIFVAAGVFGLGPQLQSLFESIF